MDQLRAGEHVEGLLVEHVHATHQTRGVEIAAQVVKTGEQRLAIPQAVERDAIEGHVVRAAAAIRLKRSMRHAEESGISRARPFHVAHLRREAHERRHRRIGCALQLRNDRTQRRPAAGRLLLGIAPGQALEGIVAAVTIGQGADDGAFVHHLRETRHLLGDLNARNVRGDRFEFAPDFARRVRLQIEDILMRRTARQEDHDHRLMRPAGLLHRFGTQHVIQRHPAHGESANPEEVSTRHTITETAAGM